MLGALNQREFDLLNDKEQKELINVNYLRLIDINIER